MLRNVWSKASLERDTKLSFRKSASNVDRKTDLNKNVAGSVNRDSGIFEEDFVNFNLADDLEKDLEREELEKEDYFLPGIGLTEKDKEDYFQPDLGSSEEQEDYLQPGVQLGDEDSADYFLHEADPLSDCEESSDEESISSCQSDRDLHASLSSLDTAAASSSLSISLSSLTTSSEEDPEAASDFDLSSSDSSDSDSDSENELCSDSEEEEASRSFGYHSLLNDSDIEEELKAELKTSDEESFNSHKTEGNFITRSASPALSFYDNLHSSSSSFSSSEDESPSDIEQKMAETEVKMCDAILSSGREELALRSKLHFQNADLVIDALTLNHQLSGTSNAFSPPNNNVYEEPFTKETMSLPLDTSNKGSSQQPPWSDNRFSSSVESPIVDAYEKECRDAPEKMAKELENKERELENKQRVLRNKQVELENELQALEDRQQALVNKKKLEYEQRMAEEQSRMELEHDQDLMAFEEVMKRAIENKEAGSHVPSRIPLDLDDLSMRHRPSPQQRRRERNALRRNNASQLSKENSLSPDGGEFDVYTMETALPKIDWETIEEHFKASQEEEEKRRRTDREEIRKKLAMGADEAEEENKRLSKKPSLHSRIKNGKNLQICFMNETASDCESQCSDTESTQDRIDAMEAKESKASEPRDFLSQQARLQEEARVALSQAKEMARMQMQLEKQSQMKSPITDIVRGSFNKIGFPCPDNKRRMSRQVLSDMNVAQLQIIVNEFHTQIENLNEVLVKLLLQRDDLHMEQDSMLVDIEDLNKHLGAKEGCVLLKQDNNKQSKKRFLKTSKLRPFVTK